MTFRPDRIVHRIAMIYREVETCGGIQRGASFQANQFRGWGIEPVILSEADLGVGEGRRGLLETALRERGVDAVIEHDCYRAEVLETDIAAARAVGVPIVAFWHSVFSWMFVQGITRAMSVLRLMRNADAVIALSRLDETFFRMLGVRSKAIPYCDPDLLEGFVRREYPHRIVWMGRLSETAAKYPSDAVAILERARAAIPDAELYMLGDGPKLDEVRAYAADLGLGEAVHFEGFRRDVRPYLEGAGVGLHTSKFEGFCHSIVEMKMASLPVVAYRMDYLETLAPGTGAIQVPQRDIEAAAAAIVALFRNPRECVRLGAEGRRAYEALRDFDQRSAYRELLDDLALPAAESRLLAPDAALITKVVQTFAEHSVMGFRAVAERAASGEAIGASGEKGARLKEILERRKSNNEELRVKLGKATELAERRKANNAALRERLEKAEEIAERRKGQIGILNGKLVQMSKIAESRKQNNAVLKAKAENADARLKSCGRAISQLEESNREKDAEISSLKSLLDRIESIVGDGEAG